MRHQAKTACLALCDGRVFYFVAYKKTDLEKQSLAAIKKNKLKFVNHLASFLPCNRATFYNLGLDKLDSIKEAIEANRISAKVKTLNKWEKSENPTLQVAYYKLIADDDEAHRLNGTKQEIKAEVTTTELITPKANDSERDS